MNDAVASLKARLEAMLGAGRGRFAIWGDPGAMTRALEDVRRRHDGAAGEAVAADKVARAVAAFRRDGKVASYVQLKHVCLGAASAAADGSALLADQPLRERMLALAESVPGGRRQMKCFQCLLRSYWTLPPSGSDTTSAASAGRAALRAWLSWRHAELSGSADKKPNWFSLLAQHANLLGMEPCERYAPALLRGDAAELQAAIGGLAIPDDSWVKEEAVLAQARAAAALDDDDWLAVLPQLLDIAAGKAGIAVSLSLSRRCVALFLWRHARCDAVALHQGLLDAAIAAIGNPWQRRAAWDAYVLDTDGKPCEPAREMVNGWLKHLLIGEFFRLHGSDGTDARRAAYWQRYDPFILSLWVGLSANAIDQRGADCEAFTRRAAGSLLLIDGLADDDNVLIMRIGDFLAVEFGGKNRALHLFRWSGLDAKLTRRLGSARSTKYFSVDALMEAKLAAKLEHQDDEKTGLPWESRFDGRLRPLVWQNARAGR